VCAAIGRATGTDPVLWRVLLAVLGFFGGMGIVVYVAAWLIIPAEGDTASPLESMLGRGRSSMSPVTVIALSVLVVVLFGLIVTDKFRAVLLGAAILLLGALLLNRNGTGGPAGVPPPHGPPGPGGWVRQPGTGPAAWTGQPGAPWAGGGPAAYRPPFAPYGPYAQTAATPAAGPPPAPGRHPRPPRERSPLGAATFSTIFLVIGALVVVDLATTLSMPPSAYFAAALATVALGLLVGAWFGRARWLIALGLVACAALGVSTLVESYAGTRRPEAPVTWAPERYDALAERYATSFDDSVLDLSRVDFTGHDARVAAEVTFGQLRVILPPDVDVVAEVRIGPGDARVFDTRWEGVGGQPRRVTDLGADGAGGGTVHLDLRVRAGSLEVIR
jgi:phage shock protein PspC (stress-responsive transcriptional regulator)